MRKTWPFFFLTLMVWTGCTRAVPEDRIVVSGETIAERVKAPQGYNWVTEESGSFGAFLQNLEVEPAGTQILDYKNNPILNQSEHVAIIKKAIGNKDLQQCADAVIRLRADYLWQEDRQERIQFHFTNGDLYRWHDHKNGIRPVLITPNKVAFIKSASFDDSFDSYKKYLDIVFTYAGTISLNKETVRVKENNAIKTGDIVVTPGSPGHALIIVGSAKNSKGEQIYLLAQGYTPAQSIHVLTNPYDAELNPWYRLDVRKKPTITARYAFKETNIRKFKN